MNRPKAGTGGDHERDHGRRGGSRIAARLLSPQGVMLGTFCAMYMITYIDRVNLATTAPFVQKELGLSPVELGLLFSTFAIPYGLLQPLGGWLGDRFGPHWVLFSAGLLWAAATAMTGLSAGVATLFVARLLLGLGEGRPSRPRPRRWRSGCRRTGGPLPRGSPIPSPGWATRSRRRSSAP